jgi:hypothetical protein
MNRKGTLATGMVLALMLGTGLTAAVPAVGLRPVSAQNFAAPGTVADQFFHVDWTVSPAGQGQARIRGYVYNDYGDAADQVQLRITELDASGNPVASFVEPVGDAVPALDRTYFDVQVPGPAASYRVAVESFNFLEAGK